MNWIEKVRSKPHEQKVRLIWLIVILSTIVLVILWIILARFNKSVPKDTSLFQTLDQGFQDVKNNYNK